MKDSCEIVRDLLPLYADGIASGASVRLVERHLAECTDCASLLRRMKNDDVEQSMVSEKTEVLSGQARFFRRKSALAGGIVAGIFMIPVLVCLIVNLAAGSGLSWFFVVLASLLTAASLTVVPLMLPENKALWTLGSFTASLVLLLGVCCLYTGGKWFFVASSASVFGMAVVFLPFAVRSHPLSAFLSPHKGLAVMASDTVLYTLMMLAIGLYTKTYGFFEVSTAVSFPFILLTWLIFLTARYLGKSRWFKAGIITALCGTVFFFTDSWVSFVLGYTSSIPSFRPLIWNANTLDGNIKWSVLLAGLAAGMLLLLISLFRRNKRK